MNLFLLRHAGWAALFAACGAAVACSSPPAQPEDTFFEATIASGSNSTCQYTAGAQLTVGTSTGQKPTTVSNGGSNGEATVSITCKVHPSGSGFDVSLAAIEQGPQGGGLAITSPAGQGAVTTPSGSMQTMATGVTANLTINQQQFRSSNCTITGMYQGAPVPVQPVASGRIWAHLSCPQAAPEGAPNAPDGGAPVGACQVEADFLFENCDT